MYGAQNRVLGIHKKAEKAGIGGGRQEDVSVYTHAYIDIHAHIQISREVFNKSFVCELIKCSEIPQTSKLISHI